MRILIAGAGIAGMTLAALLERRGIQATLVERAPDFEHAGYMIGLWPLGSRVLHGLGLYEAFEKESLACASYEAYDGHGELIRRWSIAPLNERFGPMLSCTRPQLVALLREGLGKVDLRFGTAVVAVDDGEHEVRVTLSDGSTAAYDLLVGADGLHSAVRDLVFGEAATYDSKWGGWVWFARGETLAADTFCEYWGAGRFLGAYPTTRGVGIFAGAPLGEGWETPGPGRGERIRACMAGLGERADQFLADLPADDSPMFFWHLTDVRANDWTRGHVALLGDAAAGFLPTAGIGASMAMESAAVLDDELGRTNVKFLEHALALYVKRRRRRVEAVQDQSRMLARLMFVKGTTVAALRNFASRFVSLESFAGSIVKAYDEPI